jgi:hypothetical protein
MESHQDFILDSRYRSLNNYGGTAKHASPICKEETDKSPKESGPLLQPRNQLKESQDLIKRVKSKPENSDWEKAEPFRSAEGKETLTAEFLIIWIRDREQRTQKS